jgi:hypothetical protein
MAIIIGGASWSGLMPPALEKSSGTRSASITA